MALPFSIIGIFSAGPSRFTRSSGSFPLFFVTFFCNFLAYSKLWLTPFVFWDFLYWFLLAYSEFRLFLAYGKLWLYRLVFGDFLSVLSGLQGVLALSLVLCDFLFWLPGLRQIMAPSPCFLGSISFVCGSCHKHDPHNNKYSFHFIISLLKQHIRNYS